MSSETIVNEELTSQWVIVIGNPVDGFSYHGPWDNYDDAFNVGEDLVQSESDFWIVEVTPWEA